MCKSLALTEPQRFWLEVLIENALAGQNPNRATRSYAAVLVKLKSLRGANAD